MRCLLTLILVFTTGAALASNTTLEEVVVVGQQPGPQLWKVTSQDHELWVLGVLSPLTQDLDWDASSVEAIIADSDEFIQEPHVSVSANPFGALFTLPSLWNVQNNPDKQTLQDVLPKALYTRWIALKHQYLGENKKIEKRRPIIAASQLFAAALEHTGLTRSSHVYKTVNKAVKKQKVPVTSTGVNRKLKNLRSAVKKFKRSTIDDIACFEQTIQRLEIDLDIMHARAVAWAAGDIAALRALPYQDHNATCIDSVLNSAFASDMARDMELENIQTVLRDNWLNAAEEALASNAVTFAVLPIDELLKDDGYIAMLAARGYSVRGG